MTAAPLFYVDTNILIDAFEYENADAKWLRYGLLWPSGLASYRLLTSALTITECLVEPLRLENWDRVHLYTAWLTADDVLQVVSLNEATFYAAAVLRSRYHSLKTPDALHIASAIINRCHYFATGDKGLKGPYDASHDRPLFAGDPVDALRAAPITILNTRSDRDAIDRLLSASKP